MEVSNIYSVYFSCTSVFHARFGKNVGQFLKADIDIFLTVIFLQLASSVDDVVKIVKNKLGLVTHEGGNEH